MLMNCGDGRLQRPSMGSWITYGLGSENQNLPGFIAMCPGGYPIVATQNWRSAFLPGAYQGTYIDTQHTEIDKLIENIRNDAMHPGRAAAAARPGAPAQRASRRDPRARPGARGADPVVRAGLSHAGRGGRGLRHRPGARVDPRAVRPGHPGPAAPDHPPAARARRAVHPGLERRQPALGRPREHRGPPPPARRRVGPGDRRVPRPT